MWGQRYGEIPTGPTKNRHFGSINLFSENLYLEKVILLETLKNSGQFIINPEPDLRPFLEGFPY